MKRKSPGFNLLELTADRDNWRTKALAYRAIIERAYQVRYNVEPGEVFAILEEADSIKESK